MINFSGQLQMELYQMAHYSLSTQSHSQVCFEIWSYAPHVLDTEFSDYNKWNTKHGILTTSIPELHGLKCSPMSCMPVSTDTDLIKEENHSNNLVRM